jgi:hypothetical protein
MLCIVSIKVIFVFPPTSELSFLIFIADRKPSLPTLISKKTISSLFRDEKDNPSIRLALWKYISLFPSTLRINPLSFSTLIIFILLC